MTSPYSPEFIAHQQQILLAEKDRLEQELSKVAVYDEEEGKYIAKFQEFHPGETEDEDEAVDEEKKYGENVAVSSDLIDLLTDVKQALQKIAEGKYGSCKNCDQYIPEDRLKAYPAAATCLECG